MRTSGDVDDEIDTNQGGPDGNERREENKAAIHYTNQQQAELLRKLDSIKGHIMLKNPTYGPFYSSSSSSYYNPSPYGMYPHHPSYGFTRPQNWYPNQMFPHAQYVDTDILLDHPLLLHAPNRFADMPYVPVSHHAHKLGPFIPLVVSDTTGSRRCHPLAGGAPFIACHNCFEHLYLPKKKLLSLQTQQQLQCRACSHFITFTIVDNKKLLFTSSSPLVVDDCLLKDDEPIIPRKTIIVQAVLPSQHSVDEDISSISSEPQNEVVKSVRRRVNGAKDPLPENSNLLELFEYSNVNRAALTYGMSQLGYNKQQSYAKQDSLNLKYYNNTHVSEDSRISKTSTEESRTTKIKESSQYSFSEMTNNKTVFKDEQLEVWVNGHLIAEDLVINAEKQAGPVQAGNYWYDYRAGFWGVMGHSCLGIIPPFIEEFSRPMPDNCGAGNTDVFVNGRELHERDLELLSSRGLPRDKNRSYIVDISGRVLDGDSGQELKSLGKLAPTIEKVRHGFGMRVPRFLL
ncbi:unnamed protein product [Cochlearia groenlandica]